MVCNTSYRHLPKTDNVDSTVKGAKENIEKGFKNQEKRLSSRKREQLAIEEKSYVKEVSKI